MYTPEMILEAGANAGLQRHQLNFLIQQLKIRYDSNGSQNSGKPVLGAVESPNKELLIITDEDGRQYVADNFTEADVEAVEDGLMTIIRCSDAKQLAEGGSWAELPKVDW